MSYPSFVPGAAPGRAAPRRPAAPKRLPWGWIEWFVITQTFLPALLFVRGISSVRVVIRIAAFMLAMGAWAMIVRSGRSRSGASSFPANTSLKITAGLLLLLILHWDTNSPQAGLAHALFYISVFSPAFWAPKVLESPRQVGRLMMIMLACNGLSAVIGLGQVFRPATFNPPIIPGVQNADGSESENATLGSLIYEDGYGQRIIRPCGLSDQVGSAAGAGACAALIGLAYALRPIGFLKRLLCVGLAFCGVAVIYYSQVRMILMMLIICLAVLVAIFVAQKSFGYAALLGGLGAALVLGALSWVMATSGRVVVERFLGLATTNFGETYEKSGRSAFVRNALEVEMWNNPLGSGLGRWGTIYSAFGDRSRPFIWVEVMVPAWVVDGGIPLLLLYVASIVFAMLDLMRIALRSRDRDVGFWAAVVFASNLSAIATCFSYTTFLSGIGLQFWLLAAVMHAADLRVREADAARRRAARPMPHPVAPPRPSPGTPPRPPGPYPTAPA